MRTTAADVAVLKQMIATEICAAHFAFEHQGQTLVTALDRQKKLPSKFVLSTVTCWTDTRPPNFAPPSHLHTKPKLLSRHGENRREAAACSYI
jgi:hypothetical protein